MPTTAPQQQADGPPAHLRARVERTAELIRKVRSSPFIPIEPTAKQWAFILDERREVMFGGAAGPGKSVALLATALMHVDVPSYRALLLRRSFSDLVLPGALIDLADSWLGPTTAVRKDNGKSWEFPSGAKLNFGYLANENHKHRYQSSAFHFIGFDELTQFTSSQYRYMFSRVRRPRGTALASIPLRVRSASNPGGRGHDWVKARFIDPLDEATAAGRLFIPAAMTENPHLDREAYLEMLAELDPVTRAQLEHGDWDIRPAGNFFLPTIQVVAADASPTDWSSSRVIRCRGWDLAATETGDWAVGVRLAYHPGTAAWRVEHVARDRAEPEGIERLLQGTRASDGPEVPWVVEQEGGSAGKLAMRDLRARVVAGHPLFPTPATGNKLTRARLAASIVAAGDLELAPGPWALPFLDELAGFPEVEHDDQVDALAHACHWIAKRIGTDRAPTATTAPVSEVASRPKRTKQAQVRIVR